MRAIPMGARALLLECDGEGEVLAVAAEARRRRDAGELAAVDIVPAARTVLLDGVDDPDRVIGSIARWELREEPAAEGRTVEIQVRFDGPDVGDVAAAWGMAPASVVELLCAAELRVAFCGFAPGFAYLVGHGLTTPRRDAPRTLVPAGSVALAGEYAGVYPGASPGGWQIVGTAVATQIWDPRRRPPALLGPGTTVRFRALR